MEFIAIFLINLGIGSEIETNTGSIVEVQSQTTLNSNGLGVLTDAHSALVDLHVLDHDLHHEKIRINTENIDLLQQAK